MKKKTEEEVNNALIYVKYDIQNLLGDLRNEIEAIQQKQKSIGKVVHYSDLAIRIMRIEKEVWGKE